MNRSVLHMGHCDLIELGEQVKKARTERGITQLNLARMVGLARSRVAAFEGGYAPEIAFASVIRMMQAVGLDLRPTTYNEGRPTLDDLRAEDEETSSAPRMGR